MAIYTYSLTNDFPVPHALNSDLLTRDVVASIASPALTLIERIGDAVNIVFASALDGGQVTTLNGIVAAHTGTADPLSIAKVLGSESAPTSTNAAFVLIPDMTADVKVGKPGLVLVHFTCTFEVQALDDFYLAVYVDGNQVAGSVQQVRLILGGITTRLPVSIATLCTALTPTPHTFEIRWSVNAGTARAVSTNRVITVYALGS